MAESDRRSDQVIRTQLDRSNVTVERERHLLRTARTADDAETRRAAMNELWESHSKLVVAIATQYRGPNIETVDLIGAGHLGLHTAISRFDVDRFETRLSSYAIGWIRWHIQDYLRRNAGPVRLPESKPHRQLTQMSARLLADARRTCQRDQVDPTETELYERIGKRIDLSADEVARSLRTINSGAVSLHRGERVDGDRPALEDTLADDNACTEDDVILRLDQAKARKRILELVDEILGERERAIFLARCMTDSEDIVHLDALAANFGVSRERVYQLEASARRKIATALTREGYAAFVTSDQTIRLPPARAPRRRPTALRSEIEAQEVSVVMG